MNKRKITLIISAIVIAVAAVLTGGYFIINSIKSVNDGIKDVSVINLIANPQKYDGEIVRVIGVLEWEFEGHGIYLSRDDYNYGITENAIWLDIDDGTCSWNSDDLNKMKGNYVIVEGVFNSDEKGHFDMYSGTVEKIKRIELKKSIDELNKIKDMVQNN